MKRPSRGLRESATTSRYTGRLVVPILFSRILTTCLLPRLLKSHLRKLCRVEVAQLAEHARLSPHTLATLAPQRFHHALHLLESFQHAVHLGAGDPAAGGDPLPTRALDHLGMLPRVR